MPITINNISKQGREDLLVTALEGGSNYWYFLNDLKKVNDVTLSEDGVKRECLSIRISNAVQEHNVEVEVHDNENNADLLGIISVAAMDKAEQLMYDAGGHVRELVLSLCTDEEFIADAEDADIWLQYVVMGELRFG